MRFSWALILLLGCAGVSGSQRGDLRALNAELDAEESQIDAVRVRASALSARWRDVTQAYDRLTVSFRESERRYANAEASYGTASTQFAQAQAEFEAAKERWIWARYLIEAAAAIDAANLDARHTSKVGGKTRIACDEGMSTGSFRKLLSSRGVDLTGKDIDHIVPHSLGGADHPANYQVIDSSLNRSLGATWNSEKCGLAGPERCARAVVVSRGCGAYSGSMPGL